MGTSETASININDDLAGSPQSLPLIGSGAAPLAQISAGSLDFGSVPQGTTGNAQSVTITNAGNIALSFSSINVTGSNAGEFLPNSDTCPIAPASLAAGASCNVILVFKPLGGGVRNAELDFTDNSASIPGSLQKVFLTGTGASPAPIASVFPANHDFGNVPVGTTTIQTSLTLTNTGSLPLNISDIQISGNPDFSFASAPNPACSLGSSSQLAPNASCNITAAFHASAAGIETAQITFTDNSGGVSGTAQLVGLTGNGISPVVSISPPALTVAAQLVGTSSAANPITVKNTGNTVLVFQASIGGANAADFSESDSCKGSVAAGASCNLMITFAPKAAGSRNGMLIVTATNGAPTNNQQTVPLGGTAIDFSIGAAGGSSTSATVVAGQAATFNLQLTPVNGFTGAVTLACSGAPASASCSASPASISVAGNSAIPFTLNIGTSAAWVEIPAHKPDAPLNPANWLALAILTALLLLLANLAGRRQFSFAGFAPAAVLVLLLLLTAGCGGGGGTTNASNVGPARGTFTIVVTGTTQGGSRTVSLSLTIQ